DQELCTPDTTTVMQATVPTFPGEGTWALISGTGDISDVNDPTATVTGLTIGLNTFEWVVYNGQCGFGPPTRDTLTIAVFDSTAAPAAAGPDQELCTPNTSTTMAGNAATFPGTGAWSVIAGSATIANASDPNTTISDIAVGENILVWTIDNGACGTTTDTLTILMFDANGSTANAGQDQSICVPTMPNEISMSAIPAIFPGVGMWALISGTGSIANVNDPLSAVTGLEVGVSLFSWTVDNGPCGAPDVDTVAVTVYDAASPDANAGGDQQLCSPATSATLSGSVPVFPAVGTWTIINGTGTLSDPNAPTATVSDLVTGSVQLVWTVDNGPCPNGLTTDTVTIVLFDGNSGSAAAGSDQSLCEAGPVDVTMAAIAPLAPATGTWTVVSGTGTITDVNDPNTVITGVGFGNNVFAWSVDNGPCGSGTDEVVIAIFDSSEQPADAGPDQVFCQDTTETTMAAVPLVSQTAVAAWSRLEGAGNIVSGSDPLTLIDQLAVGANIFLWTVSNGACGTTADSCIITVNDCTELVIPDAFSPNGDGVNDLYVIEGLEFYPDNSLKVYNRWGSMVLERSPYNNNWDGRSENSMNWGEELPESTYYYILDLGNDKEPFTGYIYLKR
ncbi:MAG: gliding motility-associated C-terminal domain-containing protein, partial [Flavobacteriales bacterium]|nr:gliding motility-associated C-terminal domain-containing protein [Flavobacteriales bacterium]